MAHVKRPISELAARASRPRLLGLRGAPQEAPENTRASLERALALGLDGVAYDVRACAGGELVLMADAYVDRTTDLCGLLSETSPLELSRADAGAHFGSRFGGERVPYLGEALECGLGAPVEHLVFAPEPVVLAEVKAQLDERSAPLRVRIASDELATCRAARELGLSTLWIVPRVDARARAQFEAERFDALGATANAWRAAKLDAWAGERVCVRCDAPGELLYACTQGFDALLTSEPRRALAVRELVSRAPAAPASFPLALEPLEVDASTRLSSEGEWCGAWTVRARLNSPFDEFVKVSFELVVRRGAFRASGLPAPFELGPRGVHEFEFELAGGSWSPGADPLLLARLDSPAGDLLLDAPLERVRSAVLHEHSLRLALLRESPTDAPASVTVRRHRRDLLAAIEAPGELEGARIVVRLGDEVVFGGDGVRVPLPEGFDFQLGGVPFSVGVLGSRRTPRGRRRFLRRWAGGLPDVAPSGSPGRLLRAAH